jgi:hypothetical protein
MDEVLMIEVLIDLQAEIEALRECLRLDCDVPLLTIEARRSDALLETERGRHRDAVLKRLAELRTAPPNAL